MGKCYPHNISNSRLATQSKIFFKDFHHHLHILEKMLLNFQFYLLRTSFTFCARQASNIPN